MDATDHKTHRLDHLTILSCWFVVKKNSNINSCNATKFRCSLTNYVYFTRNLLWCRKKGATSGGVFWMNMTPKNDNCCQGSVFTLHSWITCDRDDSYSKSTHTDRRRTCKERYQAQNWASAVFMFMDSFLKSLKEWKRSRLSHQRQVIGGSICFPAAAGLDVSLRRLHRFLNKLQHLRHKTQPNKVNLSHWNRRPCSLSGAADTLAAR